MRKTLYWIAAIIAVIAIVYVLTPNNRLRNTAIGPLTESFAAHASGFIDNLKGTE